MKLSTSIAVIAILVLFGTGYFTPQFTIDTWSYFELSHTIFTDFYRINTVRQFELMTDYSTSFPPLWPVLIASIRQIYDLGIHTCYLMNLLISLGILSACQRLARTFEWPTWVGPAFFLSLLSCRALQDELLAGNSIPLSVWLLIESTRIVVRCLIDHSLSWNHVISLGLLTSLNCLNRFDALLVGFAIALAIAWILIRTPIRMLTRLAVYGVIVLVLLAPWAWDNYRKFGKPFISDNSRQVAKATAGHVIDVYETPPESDLAHRPRLWLKELVTSKAKHIIRRGGRAVVESSLPLLFCVFAWIYWRRDRTSTAKPDDPITRWHIRWSILTIPLLMLPSLLAGYGEMRYCMTSFTLIFICMYSWCLRWIFRAEDNPKQARIFYIVTILVTCGWIALRLVSNHSILQNANIIREKTTLNDKMQEIQSEVRRTSGGQPHCLLYAPVDSARYGALTRDRVLLYPRLVTISVPSFINRYGITHVYDPDELMKEMDRSAMRPTQVPGLMIIDQNRIREQLKQAGETQWPTR